MSLYGSTLDTIGGAVGVKDKTAQRFVGLAVLGVGLAVLGWLILRRRGR